MKIVIKKVNVIDIKLLQDEALIYLQFRQQQLNCNFYTTYCNNLLYIENLQSIFKKFRNKIESKKPFSNINLSITEAIILQDCCHFNHKEKTQGIKQLTLKISSEIHENLINL